MRHPVFREKSYRMTVLVMITMLAGCGGKPALTEQQRVRQNVADAHVVAQTLFERELDQQASYNVRKDGFVAINFGRHRHASERS